ncbi:RNA polymerase sigma factor [Neorhodopirellula pilleata]|uniref:ECF RNA polymerase sigma factor SigE n=1 Tax=Neorhodopirellula pilleata TaxID=2714738 RepID=A0A5C6AX93_9BACT|nr:RNA polymerase sigma factor [Neorhodopirellula pilleata]TWU03686.1 ECF RNA polymerase sigma factor SigE [Neorhodopirellula pilleata]
MSDFSSSQSNAEPSGEDELIAKLLAGDESALEAFLLTHYQWLDQYIQRRIPANQKGRINSEDIIQEVYLRVFRNLPSFRAEGREQLFAWLQTIARNTLFDAFRKHRRDGKVTNEADAPAQNEDNINHLIEEFAVSSDPRSSQCLRVKELRQAFYVALGGLPEEYRQVIEMLYLQQLELPDVAERLGKSEGSIRGIRTRARQQLREALIRLSLYV